MAERRLLIKEMWNEFSSFQTQEMIDQMSEEIRDFVLVMHKLATVGEVRR